jgi:hypothetical protein
MENTTVVSAGVQAGALITPLPVIDGTRRAVGRRLSDGLPKVPCPQCGCQRSVVRSSRPALARGGVKRRRSCDECRYRFTTIELVDTGAVPGSPAIPCSPVQRTHEGRGDQISTTLSVQTVPGSRFPSLSK